MKLPLLVLASVLAALSASAQTNTIQLRNGANSTTILPSASTSITVQIPSLTAGTHYLLTSTTNPGSSGAAGSFVTYGNASSQNTTDISATNYLFNVAYSGTTVQEHALGGLISVTATGTNKNATALTLAAAATGSGTSDALYISSGRLKFLESAGATYFTTFKAGDQSADINYTLPTADGTNGQALTTNGSGTLSWSAIATSIDGLSDAKSAGTNFTGSLMLGQEPASLGVNAQYNTAVGIGALSSLTTGDNNVAVGYNALGSGATSIEAVAIGYNALAAGSGAGRVVAVGPEAGTSCATCAYSVFIGRRAGAATDVVADNTVVGNDAFRMNTSGSDNTVIGANAMENQTQGNFNTAVGRWAGVSNTTGSGSVFLGYNAGPTAAGAINNSLYIHNASSNTPLIKGDFAATTLTFNGSITTTGTSALNGNVTVGGGASASELRMLEASGSGSHYTAFKAQAQAANVTYTLPAADGTSGYALVTNGSGALSWAAAASSIDGLSDAKSGGAGFTNSLILGHESTGSLSAVDAAERNTAVGYLALRLITTGDANTALGYSALQNVTSGNQNTVLGNTAGNEITTGAQNVCIGHEAGYGIEDGGNNIAIGYGIFRNGALNATNVGSYNIGIGGTAMYNGPSGSNNIAMGYASLNAATTASSNVSIGHYAGRVVTEGNFNVAIGAYAFYDATTALNNVVIGSYASQNLTNASYNVVMGYDAAGSQTEGSSNVLLGYGVASTLTTGGTNVIVGATAGSKIVGGSGNVILGSSAGPTANASNKLYIDNGETDSPLIYGDFSGNTLTFNGATTTTGNATVTEFLIVNKGAVADEGGQITLQAYSGAADNWTIDQYEGAAGGAGHRFRIFYNSDETLGLAIEEGGNVGIGTANPAYDLDVVGDINASGSVRSAGAALTSDARLKRNIQPLVNAMDVVQRLRPVSYDKRENLQSNDYNMKQMGFIAQELEKVLPNSVSTDKSADAVKSVDYISLIPVLTKALQEQQQIINKQQAEIDELRQLIKRMSVR